ncbi:TPA: DUF2974 domain-containing protein [Streptococcus equi subsp. equi]|nr:Mbeg1-like protein [Streptococcus equi]MBT1194247.1 DUF2974 domain-containing protein [Streptococcus equi subsp. equi]MBT1197077.1 DUF2974 domain-containing protein [Streptococcus equi subsp. equi]MBT1200093.1 DUF2974 domain-containing protein [Streptococcus equi subsp. equi]MBT1201867.1 DUF2974 domain-containing protein [Streptococcus equi subsp. equi]MBT1204018.1 DUF2974 domain-containing protein [Streptococcus equi subsp. equi]
MMILTDEQRQRIAEEEYEKHTVGSPVLIDDDNSEFSIGYVSQIEDSISGFQAYVVTDVKLPPHPTKADYAQVKHVTMLYRGSTGPDQWQKHPVDVVADWVGNDLPMAMRILLPDQTPTKGTAQLRKAATFTNKTLKQYPNATFEFYGHSLGSMTVQYGVTSVSDKNLSRISGVYIYNGPNTYRVLNEYQRKRAKLLHDRIYNYVDPHDIIGMGFDQKEGAVGQVFVVNTKKVNDIVLQHMWHGYQYDQYGNMTDVNGRFVHANVLLPIDIDSDNRLDTKVEELYLGFRNYFDSSTSARYGVLSDKQTIVINAGVLTNLAQNLQSSISGDLQTIRHITEKCQAKNDAIKDSFEERKKRVSENIKALLATNGLTDTFNSLQSSLERLVGQQDLFDMLSHSASLDYPFSYDEIPYVNNNRLNLAMYDSELASLNTKSLQLASSAQHEKSGWIDSIIGRSTLLKSWQIIDEASRQLLKESDKTFEGTGLRESKVDGISDSLKEVFSVELQDIIELEKMIINTSELILGVSQNVTATDNWLGNSLKNGQFQGSADVVCVPSSYDAYLERTGLLDDVRDILQAFDEQVEQKSRDYSRKVASVYASTFSRLFDTLDYWTTEVNIFKNIVTVLERRFSDRVYVERTEIKDETSTTTRSYWGNLGALYPCRIRSGIASARAEVCPLVPALTDTIQRVNTARHRLQNLHGDLSRLIEKGVYSALDLDDIITSQKMVGRLLDKIIVELSFVKATIEASMSGQAASAMVNHLALLLKRLGYFSQLVADCFGTQVTKVPNKAPARASHKVKRFSLNNPLALQ